MTINELITRVNTEKPNSFQTEDLLKYINAIEAEVAEQLGVAAEVYTSDDLGSELLAPSPYDRLYISWLKANIDFANEEYASYENNQAQHIQDFMDFTDYIVRDRVADISIPTRFINVM